MNKIKLIVILLMFSNMINAATLQPDERIREDIKSEQSDRTPAFVLLMQIVDQNENSVHANIFLNNDLVCENSSSTTLILPAKAEGTILEVQAKGYNSWKVELNYKVDNYLEKPLLVRLIK